jgi:hypothetical protein
MDPLVIQVKNLKLIKSIEKYFKYWSSETYTDDKLGVQHSYIETKALPSEPSNFVRHKTCWDKSTYKKIKKLINRPSVLV